MTDTTTRGRLLGGALAGFLMMSGNANAGEIPQADAKFHAEFLGMLTVAYRNCGVHLDSAHQSQIRALWAGILDRKSINETLMANYKMGMMMEENTRPRVCDTARIDQVQGWFFKTQERALEALANYE